MPKHEEYEELCTLAMIGEASAAELKNLKEHLDDCDDCRREYREFVQFLLPQLSLVAGTQSCEDLEPEDREALRAKFLTQATSAGVPFSEEAVVGPDRFRARSDPSAAGHATRLAPTWRHAWAAGVAFALAFGAFAVGRQSAKPRALANAQTTSSTQPLSSSVDASEPTLIRASSPADQNQITALRQELKDAIARYGKAEAAVGASRAGRERLENQLAQQTGRVSELERDKNDSDAARDNLQTRLAKQEEHESTLEADYAGELVKIVELNDKLQEQGAALQRQHEMAETDSQVRNLLSSRNLHIVDVFDTDTHGQTKPIFGRVFFAESKQLLFYAYDLNDTRGRDVGVDYRVWGQKEAPGQKARSLGVFHPDDKAQNRWIFEYDNPRTLAEIDSIFVTLERSDSPRSEPKGQKLMYAYLRDHPNHP